MGMCIAGVLTLADRLMIGAYLSVLASLLLSALLLSLRFTHAPSGEPHPTAQRLCTLIFEHTRLLGPLLTIVLFLGFFVGHFPTAVLATITLTLLLVCFAVPLARRYLDRVLGNHFMHTPAKPPFARRATRPGGAGRYARVLEESVAEAARHDGAARESAVWSPLEPPSAPPPGPAGEEFVSRNSSAGPAGEDRLAATTPPRADVVELQPLPEEPLPPSPPRAPARPLGLELTASPACRTDGAAVGAAVQASTTVPSW